MDLIAAISGLGALLIFTVVPFLLVITLVVFIHELGHFLVARWCGVKIAAFSIGFGPEIYGFDDRHGTRWRFAWIPLGGYVKFIDDENAASVATPATAQPPGMDGSGRFHTKPLWQRASVVAAGPIFNILLAIVLFSMMFIAFGERITPARIDDVKPGGPAERAGLRPGDIIEAVNGEEIRSFNQFALIVNSSPGRELQLTIRRDGTLLNMTAVPELQQQEDLLGGKVEVGMIGIVHKAEASDVVIKSYGLVDGIARGFKETHAVTMASLRGLWDIVSRKLPASQLAGPTKIAEVVGKVAAFGPEAILRVAAYISLGLGIFNLLPIPVLDGGHLMFYAYEGVAGRPLPERFQEYAYRLGITLLMLLMVFTVGMHIAEKMGL
jgi:regulator of sigma E protease